MQKLLEEALAHYPEGCSTRQRNEIFKEIVGEDKNGYAKTFGKGVIVPRSKKKRCALEEERTKRIKTDEKVDRLEKQVYHLKNMVKKLCQHHVSFRYHSIYVYMSS